MMTDFHQRLQEDGHLIFSCSIHPGAKRTSVKEILSDGTIKIDIAAVPEDGKANKELLKFLAKTFGVSHQNIEILSGARGRRKAVKIMR